MMKKVCCGSCKDCSRCTSSDVDEVGSVVTAAGCEEALGMESCSIADTQISGSSEWDAHHAASLGRLHSKILQSNAGSWWARTNDKNQWLQIDLGDQATKVTGVATQGGGNPTNHWVRKYKLQYSEDGETFHDYREQQHDTAMEFDGNTDPSRVVRHELFTAITARYIRFVPTAWHWHVSMRVEVYGCLVRHSAPTKGEISQTADSK